MDVVIRELGVMDVGVGGVGVMDVGMKGWRGDGCGRKGLEMGAGVHLYDGHCKASHPPLPHGQYQAAGSQGRHLDGACKAKSSVNDVKEGGGLQEQGGLQGREGYLAESPISSTYLAESPISPHHPEHRGVHEGEARGGGVVQGQLEDAGLARVEEHKAVRPNCIRTCACTYKDTRRHAQ